MRAHTTAELIGSELFPPRSPVRAMIVQPVHAGDIEPDQAVRQAINRALEYVRGTLTPGYVLTLVRHDHGFMLISSGDPVVRATGVEAVAADLQASLTANLEAIGVDGWRALCGVGEEQASLTDAITSYDQARHAVRVASV